MKTFKPLVLLAAITIAALGSCSKDDETQSLYTPPATLTKSEIIALIGAANTTLNNEAEVTITRTSTSVRDGKTSKEKKTFSVNTNTKKALDAEYDISSKEELTEFDYIENFVVYRYRIDETSKESHKVTDAYYNNAIDRDYLRVAENYDWKVEGNTLVGTAPSSNETRKYLVTFTESKRFNTIQESGTYTYGGAEETWVEDYTFAYSANPAIPDGFQLSDFKAVDQYSFKVVWGEGKGENIFYGIVSNDGRAPIYTSDIIVYAPKVAGKTPRIYDNEQFSTETPSFFYMYPTTDGKTTLYAKWE